MDSKDKSVHTVLKYLGIYGYYYIIIHWLAGIWDW